jgi:hypothetical protein
MDKWDLMVLRDSLEDDATNPARLYLTLRDLLDMMIDEATTDHEDEPDEQ